MPSSLSEKQRIAAELLAAGKLCKVAAAAVDVSPETVSVWRRQPAFRAYCNSLRNEAHFAARDALRNIGPLAVGTLEDLLKASTSDETRRKAAGDVLRMLGHEDINTAYLEGGFNENP